MREPVITKVEENGEVTLTVRVPVEWAKARQFDLAPKQIDTGYLGLNAGIPFEVLLVRLVRAEERRQSNIEAFAGRRPYR